MIAQIIELTGLEIINKYKDIFNIPGDVFPYGDKALLLRQIKYGAESEVVSAANELNYNLYQKISNDEISFLIPGSFRSLMIFADHLKKSLSGSVRQALKNYNSYGNNFYDFGRTELRFNRINIMGILNVTPDSFSDGGRFSDADEASGEALRMISDGADIIDVGGESTRPGSQPVPEKDELKRIVPVIKKIRAQSDVLISVDTTKAVVAEAALDAGADIINDISAGTFDNRMFGIAAKYNAAISLMHIKGTPADMQKNPSYDDVTAEVFDFLTERCNSALSEGINKIFIDPGIGFGKRVEDNFELINRLKDFTCMGFPILIGVSRKSFIGKTLNLEVTERDTATSVVESFAVKNGARIIRTHNIKNAVQLRSLAEFLT